MIRESLKELGGGGGRITLMSEEEYALWLATCNGAVSCEHVCGLGEGEGAGFPVVFCMDDHWWFDNAMAFDNNSGL